jgi:hypothetical protein
MVNKYIYSVKAHFQVIAFLVTVVVLAIIFYTKTIHFYGFDPLPVLKEFPNHVSSNASSVYMGLHISSFSEFKVAKGEFAFSGSVWFQYDPRKVSLEDIKQFKLMHGELISISIPMVKRVGDQEVAQFEITAQFKNRLNYSAFPLGDHYVTIGIVNYSLPEGTILRSAPDDFEVDSSIDIPGWRVLSRTVKEGLIDRFFGKNKMHHIAQTGIFFILECKRTDPVFLITILISLLIILLVAMMAFSIEDYSGDLIAGAIGGIIAFRFVISALTPDDVGYFMLVDYLFILGLVSVVSAVLGCVMARQFHWSERIQNGLVVGIYSFFVLGAWLSLWLIERL